MKQIDKIVAYAVDSQTLRKFKTTKKLKDWLRAHPNYVWDNTCKLWVHVYEYEFQEWEKATSDEQHNRPRPPVESTEGSEEEGTEDGEVVPSGAE